MVDLRSLIAAHLEQAIQYECAAARTAYCGGGGATDEVVHELLTKSRRTFDGALMLENRLYKGPDHA